MAKVELKQPIVQKIADTVKDAQAVVLVDYRGITVEEDVQLRRELREAGVTYKVFKNTMMRRAFEGTALADLDPYLEGPNAIAVSVEDVTAPARIIAKYAKINEALEMKAGVVEGAFYNVEQLSALAAIPSREELLSKLLGSLKSPITNFARVLSQIAENGGAAEAEKPEEAAAEDAKEAAPAEEAKAEAAEEAPAEAEKPEEAAAEDAKEEAPAEEAKTEEK